MPEGSAATSSALGFATRTTAAASASRFPWSASATPLSAYCSSGNPARTPAPRSTTTSNPDEPSFAAASRRQSHPVFAGRRLPGHAHSHLAGNLREGFRFRAGNQTSRGPTCRLRDRHGCLRPRSRRARRQGRRERGGRGPPARLGGGAARGAQARRGPPRRRQGERQGGGADEARPPRRPRAGRDPCAPGRGHVADRRGALAAARAAVRALPPRALGRTRVSDATRRHGDPRRGPDPRGRGRVRRDDVVAPLPPGARPPTTPLPRSSAARERSSTPRSSTGSWPLSTRATSSPGGTRSPPSSRAPPRPRASCACGG